MSPACIGNLNVGSLPFSLVSRFFFFFCGDYHGATPICRGTNRYGTDDASFVNLLLTDKSYPDC